MGDVKKNLRKMDTPIEQGLYPDSMPRYTPTLAAKWFEQYVEAGNLYLATAVEGSRYRASWAGSCQRELQYNMRGTDQSDPTTVADAWRFNLGSMVHQDMQAVLAEAFPDAEIEKKVDLEPIMGFPASAHLDLFIPGSKRPKKPSAAVEVKSINGFGYKMAASTFKGPPEGPRDSAIIQGALAALALDADELVIMYFSLELLSPQLAAGVGIGGELGRFTAEWTFPRKQYEPIARNEIERVKLVMDYVEADVLAPRRTIDIPVDAVITDPVKGTGQRADGSPVRTWKCGYCGHRTTCIADGA
jgi:hypothetical protein